MGYYVTCPECETRVYTTGSRMPRHKDSNNHNCVISRVAREPVEYAVGLDSDPGVYQGGLPELGQDA